jgi:hypothetical protein
MIGGGLIGRMPDNRNDEAVSSPMKRENRRNQSLEVIRISALSESRSV